VWTPTEDVDLAAVQLDQKGVMVTLELRKRRHRICSECGHTGWRLKIVENPTKTWRHLDLGVTGVGWSAS
jgi:hypothetical protein